MIPLSLSRIAAAVGGSVVVPPDRDVSEDVLVDGPVVTDSRQAAPGSLYVARVGERADGHDFAGDAAARGAVATLSSRPVPELPSVVVADVQEAFAALVQLVLDQCPDLTVIGLTGSSGKTTTKDLIAAVLSRHAPTVANSGSLNNEVGVPLTACRVEPATRYLVVEMGARGIGHIRYLADMVRPRIGVVLNIGSAHAGEFGGRQCTAAAKGELVEALPAEGIAVLNADDALVRAMTARTAARVCLVGRAADAQVRAERVVIEGGRARFTLATADGSAEVRLRLVGEHQVGNALAVAGVALGVGMPLADVAVALSEADLPSRFRMEVHDRPDGVTVVNDAYNANPDSMAAALRAVAGLAGGRRTWAVLGEMLELGEATREEHCRIGAMAAGLGIDRLLAVGEGARPILAGFERDRSPGASAGGDEETGPGIAGRDGDPTVHDRGGQWVADADEAWELLTRDQLAGDVILVKSSNSIGLWSLGDRLAREVVAS